MMIHDLKSFEVSVFQSRIKNQESRITNHESRITNHEWMALLLGGGPGMLVAAGTCDGGLWMSNLSYWKSLVLALVLLAPLSHVAYGKTVHSRVDEAPI